MGWMTYVGLAVAAVLTLASPVAIIERMLAVAAVRADLGSARQENDRLRHDLERQRVTAAGLQNDIVALRTQLREAQEHRMRALDVVLQLVEARDPALSAYIRRHFTRIDAVAVAVRQN